MSFFNIIFVFVCLLPATHGGGGIVASSPRVWEMYREEMHH